MPSARTALDPVLADGGPRVLLVDDELSVRQSVERILSRLGFSVTVVQSGPEALRAIARLSFSAVVTDQNMPGMSGGELVRRIIQRAPELREHIVLASGNLDNDETRHLVGELGCHPLAKPFRLTDLAEAVTRATQGVRSPR